MRLLVTTINRQCPVDEVSGCVYEVDAENGSVLGHAAIPESPLRELDPNPRGGMRGGRGVAFDGEWLFIANFSLIHQYDRDWRLRRVFSHPSCADIHELVWRNGLLWVCSTRNDTIVAFDADGRVEKRIGVNAHRESPTLLDFRNPVSHVKAEWDATHLNALCFLRGGEMLLSLGLTTPRGQNEDAAYGKSTVLRANGDGRREIVIEFESMQYPIHNLVPQPDGTVLSLDTTNGALMRFHGRTGTIVSRRPLSRSFLRGLCRFPDGCLAIGAQNTVLIFDPAQSAVVRTIRLTDNERESVHSVHIIPANFSRLPGHLDGGAIDMNEVDCLPTWVVPR